MVHNSHTYALGLYSAKTDIMARKEKVRPNADITDSTIKKVKYIFLKSGCGYGYAYMVGDTAELSDEAINYLSEKQIIERI